MFSGNPGDSTVPMSALIVVGVFSVALLLLLFVL